MNQPAEQGTSAAASLALLQALWDRDRRDYLSIFVPFVAESLRLSDAPVVAMPDLQADLKERFGLMVPQHSLKAVVARAQRQGYVRVENRAFVPNRDALNRLTFERDRDDILTSYEALVRALREFAVESLQLEWKSADAEAALAEYITSGVVTIDPTGAGVVAVAHPPSSSVRYSVARFVDRLAESDSPLLRQMGALQQGYMLGNALYLPDQGQVSRRFRRTAIYFDTPFLMRALGYATDARQAPCVELLDLLYETGAQLCCFRHTVEELTGALEAAAGYMRNSTDRTLQGPLLETVQHFLAKGYDRGDVELFVVRLERDLANMRVAVVDTPRYDEHKHVIDEEQLKVHLRERISYRGDEPLDKDVRSIAAIVRARRGRTASLIEDSGALFVTTNNALVEAARSFFTADSPQRRAAVCINDFTLTNVVWLKSPTRAPDLPLKQLIADAHAALQPGDELWRAFTQHVRRDRDRGLITPDDYYDLRYSLASKSTLMELTRGSAEAFTEGSVLQILQVVRETREAQARASVQKELDDARAGEDRLAQVLRTVQGERQEQERRLAARATRLARIAVTGIAVVAVCVIVIGTWTTSPWGGVGLSTPPWSYVATICGVVVLTVAGWSMYHGTAVVAWLRRLETEVQRSLLRLLRRMAALEP
jgi:hypothetical protein